MRIVVTVLNAGLCSGMHGYVNKDGCEAVLKFFTKRKQKKNKKKMLFFASHDSRRQSRFAREKYSFRREAEKRKIFPEATRRA